MSNDTVQQIEENIRQAKSIVEMDESLQRLTRNKDFQRVISKGYLVDEAVRLVHLKVDPSMATPERQASIDAQINGIGQLLSFFRTVTFNAGTARKAIESDEATRDEILAEELSNG